MQVRCILRIVDRKASSVADAPPAAVPAADAAADAGASAAATEKLSEALVPIHKELLDLRDTLKAMQEAKTPPTEEALQPLQERLDAVDNKRVDGIFGGSLKTVIPEGQAILHELMDEAYDLVSELVVKASEMPPEMKQIYDTLCGLKRKLQKMKADRSYSLEDIHHYQLMVDAIDSRRVDGIFAGNLQSIPPGQAQCSTVLFQVYELLRILLGSAHDMNAEMRGIYTHLIGIKRKLIELKSKHIKHSTEDLHIYQLQLDAIDRDRVEGIFGGSPKTGIPAGQAEAEKARRSEQAPESFSRCVNIANMKWESSLALERRLDEAEEWLGAAVAALGAQSCSFVRAAAAGFPRGQRWENAAARSRGQARLSLEGGRSPVGLRGIKVRLAVSGRQAEGKDADERMLQGEGAEGERQERKGGREGEGKAVRVRGGVPEQLLCGGFAGIVSRTAVAPLDLIRVRQHAVSSWFGLFVRFALADCSECCMQQAVTALSSLSSAHSLSSRARTAICSALPPALPPTPQTHLISSNGLPGAHKTAASVFSAIMAKDGWKGFFRGNGVNCLRVGPHKAVELCTFEMLRRLLNRPGHPLQHVAAPVSGAAAGLAGTLLTYPLELIRTRISVQPELYRDLGSTVRKIVQEEGALSLYRGIVPSLLGVVPYAATNYFVYDALRTAYRKATGREQVPNEATLLFGAAAASASSAVTFPLEVVRRRLQLGVTATGAGAAGRQTAATILKGIIETEGVLAVYRGLGTTWLKLLPAAGISFVCYEAARVALRAWNGKQQICAMHPCHHEKQTHAHRLWLHLHLPAGPGESRLAPGPLLISA
ncbi:unnamed protein product [Closterium sp. NIES-64]|nr:unnamed protein product [Closterium sp. NIES-64]